MKFLTLLFPLFCWAEICLFTPPKGWEAAQPQPPSEVQIGFLGKGNSPFRPSMNLATEEVDCTLQEYLDAVKKIHLQEPGTRWQDLGAFRMKGGVGRLIDVSHPASWGECHIFQAILVKAKMAYILTAAVAKEDLLSKKSEIFSALASLELSPSVWHVLPQGGMKTKLMTAFEGLGKGEEKQREWEAFQALVLQETSSLGGYWQFLVLKEGYAKIHP